MTIIKKFITGFVLILCFITSAFASNTTKIAISMNQCFSNIEKMALYEHENNASSSNDKLKKYVAYKLRDFNAIFLECEQASVPNFEDLTKKTISIAFELKDRMLLDFKSNYVKDYSKSLMSSDTAAHLFALSFYSMIIGIYDYLDKNDSFLEQQYSDFTAGLKNSKLLEDEKKSLFDALIQCKVKKE